MLYTRTSFIKYLREVHYCTFTPLNQGKNRVLLVTNGPAKAYILVTGKDRIDYEEIHIICTKLWLPDLPGDKDLEKIE